APRAVGLARARRRPGARARAGRDPGALGRDGDPGRAPPPVVVGHGDAGGARAPGRGAASGGDAGGSRAPGRRAASGGDVGGSRAPGRGASVGRTPRVWLGLAGAYAATALWVYRRALAGGPVSDDHGYLGSPWIRHFDASAAAAILDPGGAPAAHTANYAPLHLLAHGLAMRAFGDAWVAHHLLNVALHVGCALLVAALLA